MAITRRNLLIGGGAAALVVAGAGAVAVEEIGPRRILNHLVDQCGAPGALPPATRPVVRTGTLTSSHVHRPLGWSMVWPEGTTEGAALPVCIALPGLGGTHADVVDGRQADWVTDMTRTRGHAPFALASLDGGADYWHRRANGDDRLSALLTELLPLLAAHGLGTDGHGRALYGWSMGGYGALLAAETAPEQFRAVGVSSPALGTTKANSPRIAFDSEADFAAHDVYRRAARLRGLAVRVDCGDGDPFQPFAQHFVKTLAAVRPALTPGPQSAFGAGCHDEGYWRRMRPAQFDAIAVALARR